MIKTTFDTRPTFVTKPARRRPGQLMNFIVALLAPMFLGVSEGDVGYARMAAIETINAYRARNNADLIAVVQIIAFGLAALGPLSLSLADEHSITMALRLRGNANACNRSAEQNRRARRESHAISGSEPVIITPDDEILPDPICSPTWQP